jgi:hypothetical protein
MLSAAHTWSLTAIAIASSIALLWVFGRFSNRERVARAKRQVRAQLYAMRLYGGEPALIFRAQKQLLIWNARYLALMLPAAAIALVPGILLFMELDNLYGHRPLAAGESAIVTAGFSGSADLRTFEPMLEGRGVIVETPAVRLPDRHEACWRVRALHSESGSMLRRRVSLRGTVRWIEVSCPAARIRVFGYGMNWLVWFLAVSLVTALVVSRLGIPALRL